MSFHVLSLIGHRVVGLHPETMNRIGFARLHLFNQDIFLGPGPEVFHQGVFIGTDPFFTQFAVKVLTIQLDDLFSRVGVGRHLVSGAADDIPARYVEIAGDGDQMVDGHNDRGPLRIPFHGPADLYGSRAVFTDHSGCLNDLLLGYPGNFSRPLGCVLLDPFG